MEAIKSRYQPRDFREVGKDTNYGCTLGRSEWERLAMKYIDASQKNGSWTPLTGYDGAELAGADHMTLALSREHFPDLVESGFAVEPYGAGNGLVFTDSALLKIFRKDPRNTVQMVQGKPPVFSAQGYQPRSSVGHTTFECLDYLKGFFTGRIHHRLSVVELNHRFSGRKESNPAARDCVYLILDASSQELVRVDGMTKGYAGEGPRGALTLDVYIDLLNIPVERHTISSKALCESTPSNSFPARDPTQPSFNLDNLERARSRANKASIVLPPGYGFDKLRSDMKIEEMMELMDFHKHGYYQ